MADISSMSIMERLELVRVARLVFGQQAARRTWIEAGLPIIDGGARSSSLRAELEEFITCCIESELGAPPVQARRLYRHYLEFAGRRQIPPVSATAFGRAMGTRFHKASGRLTYYHGLRLHDADAPPPAMSDARAVPRNPAEEPEPPETPAKTAIVAIVSSGVAR